jgi:hypothetical protein
MSEPIRHNVRRFALLLACLPLAACYYDPPPSDFDPVPPATPRLPGDTCPDLDGLAVDLAGDPLAAAITDRAPPPSHGLPMVLAIRRGVTHQELWWVIPREDLLAFARDLRTRSPQRYAEWRTLVLRGTLEGSRSWDFDGWLEAVTRLGPPGPVYAGIVGYGCEEFWARAREQGTRYADGEATERELWLARDRRGDLLLRDATVRMKTYSGWGGQTSHLRTGVRSTWRRIPALAGVSTAKLTEDELPVPLTLAGKPASDPGQAMRSCTDAPDRLVAFSQRLRAALPAGTELVRFVPEPAPAGRPRDCALLVVEVAFEGATAQALAQVDQFIRRDPDVRSLDRLPADADGPKPRRTLRVTLQ